MNDTNFYRLLNLMPNFLYFMKPFFIKKRLKFYGKNVIVSPYSFIAILKNSEIHNDVFIGKDFYCSSKAGVIIEERVMFGAKCSIIGGDHNFEDPNMNMRMTDQLGENNKIIVEKDAWIGHGTTLLKKAFVAEGSIIGANSLVNKKLKPYFVYAGNPLKEIKTRFNSFSDLEFYLKMMEEKYLFKSKYSLDYLKEIYTNR